VRATTVFLILLLLTGCGIADHFNQSAKVDQDEKDYRACLSANTAKPETCNVLKEVWQTDKADYVSGKY
jgi:hypothetical protein